LPQQADGVLASGDPFLAWRRRKPGRETDAGEWIAYSAPSTFSLAAARLGWRLEAVAASAFMPRRSNALCRISRTARSSVSSATVKLPAISRNG